jgi:hypothetical protein
LLKLFAELERLVAPAISTTRRVRLRCVLGFAIDTELAHIALDDDPVRAVQVVAKVDKYFSRKT